MLKQGKKYRKTSEMKSQYTFVFKKGLSNTKYKLTLKLHKKDILKNEFKHQRLEETPRQTLGEAKNLQKTAFRLGPWDSNLFISAHIVYVVSLIVAILLTYTLKSNLEKLA